MSAAEKSVFITGASRGIGAATAREFALRHYDVGIGYMSKERRAKQVFDDINRISPGSINSVFSGDITSPEARAQIVKDVGSWAPQLGALILNAAGGLEKGRGPNYGLEINRDAQAALAEGLVNELSPGGTVVYETSHWAHLHGQIKLPPFDYEVVASSKRAGENRLRAMIPELTEKEIRLIVVSGGLVTGTFVGDLPERMFPEFLEAQQAIGNVVTAEDMALAIANSVENPDLPSGHTVVVGAPFEALLS